MAAYEQAQARQDTKNLVWIAESLASVYIEERLDEDKGSEWLTALGSRLQDFHDPHEAEQASRPVRSLTVFNRAAEQWVEADEAWLDGASPLNPVFDGPGLVTGFHRG